MQNSEFRIRIGFYAEGIPDKNGNIKYKKRQKRDRGTMASPNAEFRMQNAELMRPADVVRDSSNRYAPSE